MKIQATFIAMIGLLGTPLAADGNDFDVYFFGGFSVFPEGTSHDLNSKEGFGNRWGVGFQINRIFSLEVTRDSVPGIDESSIIALFERDFDDTITNYDIEATYNRFSSVVGTITVPLAESAKFIGKLGYASYAYESKVEFQSRSGIQYAGKLEEDHGLTPTASLGVEFPFRSGAGPLAGIEFAVTKMFEEEIESVYGTVSFLVRF